MAKKKSSLTFAVGDSVKWTSQAQGNWVTKYGVVERVVPPGQRPDDYVEGCGFGRKHESYLVKVVAEKPGGTGRHLRELSKPRYYWPVVSKLARV